jgi:hypothetical protein
VQFRYFDKAHPNFGESVVMEFQKIPASSNPEEDDAYTALLDSMNWDDPAMAEAARILGIELFETAWASPFFSRTPEGERDTLNVYEYAKFTLGDFPNGRDRSVNKKYPARPSEQYVQFVDTVAKKLGIKTNY